MATVYQEGGKGPWVIKWRDERGQWRRLYTKCRTKTEAKNQARDLEHNAQRKREGLPPDVGTLQKQKFEDILDWWMEKYGDKSRDRVLPSAVKKHIRPALGPLPLAALTTHAIDAFLREREGKLSPRALNHMRGIIHRVFAEAKDAGSWFGENPAAAVKRREEPEKEQAYLTADEAMLLLDNLQEHWRPLFATALYTGMRKGELIGLRKVDVDLAQGFITVRRSYDHAPKGKRALRIPIAAPLRPWLEKAIAASPSEYVFPNDDGGMRSHKVAFEDILRRALARAGIVDGWVMKCRRKGCGFQERRKSGEVTPCPAPSVEDATKPCGFKLWPAPVHRKDVRFHSIRHTTASLLIQAGAPIAVTQRILRHADPRITMKIYAHLEMEHLAEWANKLPAKKTGTGS